MGRYWCRRNDTKHTVYRRKACNKEVGFDFVWLQSSDMTLERGDVRLQKPVADSSRNKGMKRQRAWSGGVDDIVCVAKEAIRTCIHSNTCDGERVSQEVPGESQLSELLCCRCILRCGEPV